MAIPITSSNKFRPRPRFLLYSKPGGAKTSLAATCSTPGTGDMLFGFTEGGVQSVAHLAVSYTDVTSMKALDDIIAMFRGGKKSPEDGVITVGNKDFRGFTLDLAGEFVDVALSEMCGQATARIEKNGLESALDDPSQYEYKKLNMRIEIGRVSYREGV